MCGGCGAQAVLDWTTPVTTGPAARSAVALTANALCRAVGAHTHVAATPGGYTVRSATGGTVVASTVTDVWRAVGDWRVRAGRTGLPPVTDVVGGAAGGGASAPVLAARGPRVAVLLGSAAGSDRAWADAVVSATRWNTAPDAAGSAVDDLPLDGNERVLVECASVQAVQRAVQTLGTPRGRRRCRLVALVGRGHTTDLPRWVDRLDGLDPASAVTLLDGGPPPLGTPDAAGAGAAAVACWLSAAVAAGAAAGERWRVRAGSGDDAVLLDVADGVGIGVRPI